MERRMLSLQVSPDKREKIKARLLASLIEDKETGCWNWVRSKNLGGYGIMRAVPVDGKNRMYMVHRVSYALFVDDIPENMCICHRCDNRSCANPEHLFLGTLNDNIQDRKNKDRSARMFGESNPFSKYDENTVRIIRASKKSGTDLGKELGIPRETIYNIRKYRSWKHIADDPFVARLANEKGERD